MISVLVVDDDDGASALAARILHDDGYAVAAARSAQASALRNANVEVLVIEILLEDRDGLEILREIRQRSPGCAIVAVCGGGRFVTAPDALSWAAAIGADATLMKPFAAEDLLAAVRTALVMHRPSRCRSA